MDILDRFIEQAGKSLESGYYDVKERANVKKASLRDTLMKQDFSLISEIKHASPAGEYSFDDIDVEKTAELFREAGSDAISSVVEPAIFKGNLDNVPVAKKTGLPVLFKDFVRDERQIKAASMVGADAVLLIVKVADRLRLDLDSMIEKAHSNGLEVLLECYDDAEMQKALRTDADILGINNRDLQTLKVDINRTKEIMEAVPEGEGRPMISESGIKTKDDAEFVKATGVKGILVGTALWKSEDMPAKIRELRLR